MDPRSTEAERLGRILLDKGWPKDKAEALAFKSEVEQSRKDVEYTEWLKRMKRLASQIATLASYPNLVGAEQQRKEILELIGRLSQ